VLHDELVGADNVFPAGGDDGDADDDVPELAIHRGLVSDSELTNAHVAESTHTQYNHDNADFMMYLWDEQPELLCIPAMEMLNLSSAPVLRAPKHMIRWLFEI
jgi:hypothetical protein